MSLLSTDSETLSTVDGLSSGTVRPSISRRSSRPSSLHIHNLTEWKSELAVQETTPLAQDEKPDNTSWPSSTQEQHDTPRLVDVPIPSSDDSQRPVAHNLRAMDSPCFVHSHLDKGASLTEWLRTKQHALIGAGDIGVAQSLKHTHSHSGPPDSSESTETDDEYETDYSASLTKQLAETAMSVREISKQLGRTRIHTSMQTVLIVTKARDNRLIKLTRELALYLMLKRRRSQKRGLVVYVDHQLRHSRRFDADGIKRAHPELFNPSPRRRTSSSNSLSSLGSSNGTSDNSGHDHGQLRYWTPNMCTESPHLFDFVVTLGGDGTVLFTSWLFQRIVPPVLSFALGSLGFLTNFDFNDYQAVMDSALDTGIRVNLRMRFTCTVYRAVHNSQAKRRKAVKKADTGEILMKNVEKGGWEALEGGWSGGLNVNADGNKCAKDKEIKCFTTRPAETFEVLNDLVVDRGPSPYVSLLELFGDEHHMTTVQADGLTVSTPTGSTAYSLSAGGSLVHPEIPAILITPICPHTLSFRPMLLPDSMELRICVPYNSRSTAWASFDGRGRVELRQGDHIKVTASKYPYPTVCPDQQSTDWFHAISRTLKWNERERQKSFVVVEEESPVVKPPTRSKRSEKLSQTHVGGEDEEISDEEEEDEEEEDKFDIDDSSAEAKLGPLANTLTVREARIGQEKALEQALGLSSVLKGPRSPSPHSGVETPGRFACPQPHLPPRQPPLHPHADLVFSPPSSSASENTPIDHAHSMTASAVKHRPMLNERLVAVDDKTPTVQTLTHSIRGRPNRQQRAVSRRSKSFDHHHGRRAFAVWGNDESDSNISDASGDS